MRKNYILRKRKRRQLPRKECVWWRKSDENENIMIGNQEARHDIKRNEKINGRRLK